MSGTSIEALGAVTAAGVGIDALAAALADPDYSAELGLERPDAAPLPVAQCRSFDPRAHLTPLVARRLDRPARLLAVAAREALASLGDTAPWPGDRTGVAAGTWNAGTAALVEVLRTVFTVAPDEAPPAQFPSTVANAPASQLGILEKLAGPNLTFFEKQAGGTRAIVESARLLHRGRADAVVACGVDEAQWLNAEGYERLRALAAPGRQGMILAEGAAALVLARQAGADPVATLAGSGSWSVPAEPHRYPDTPVALVEACRRALADAEVAPRQVDLVVGASNGIPALDVLEIAALKTIFGEHGPAFVAPARRLGEGAFAGVLHVVIAALAVAGRASLAWAPPDAHAGAGLVTCDAAPAVALVYSVAAGGSAVAVVVTRR